MGLTIVHVSTQRGWHGGEEQARLLIHGLAARGHRCVVFARSGGAFASRMAQEGFEVLPLAGSGRGFHAMWQSRVRLRGLKPDVVHFHDPHALSGTGLAAWRLAIPARVVARRVDFPIRSPRRYRDLANRVIAVSHAVGEVCRTSGLDAQKIRVVPDGVEPSRGRSGNRQRGRQSLGLASDVPMILCVATLTDHKGHTFLLQAMPAVLSEFPSARLMLAGDGELRAALETEARSLGIDRAVNFLGYRADVPDLLKAADLFVMPSHMEGLCSSLIDVMFARTPIVSTTAGGIPEILGSEVLGDFAVGSPTSNLPLLRGEASDFLPLPLGEGRGEGLKLVRPSQEKTDPPVARLVPPRNPAALASEIIASLKNPAALQSLVDRAELRAQRLFTADRMVENTLGVYAELLPAHQTLPANLPHRRAA